jgi:hypothetical protein
MKPDKTTSHVVKLRFQFGGTVTKQELYDALGRAFKTKQFRLAGQYTILESFEEQALEESPREAGTVVSRQVEAAPAPSSLPSMGPTSGHVLHATAEPYIDVAQAFDARKRAP